MKKVKDCPFCGGVSKLLTKRDNRFKVNIYEVSCKDQMCYGFNEYSESGFRLKSDAIKYWNRRSI